MQSQSQDCEPPVPQYAGSYTNLFDGSQGTAVGARNHSMSRDSPHLHSPGRSRYAPGMAQRTAGVGAESQPPNMTGGQRTPPPPRHFLNSPGAGRSLASDEKYPTNQALITDTVPTSPGTPGGARSPVSALPPTGRNTSRYASGDGQSAGMGGVREHRNNNVINQQRENGVLAGIREYKQHSQETDLSNTTADRRSRDSLNHNSGSAAPINKYHNKLMEREPSGATYRESGYSSSSGSSAHTANKAKPSGKSISVISKTHGNGSHADNLGVGRNTKPLEVPGSIRRPMSFVKALEMSETLSIAERPRTQHDPRVHKSASLDDQYGSTYEISV